MSCVFSGLHTAKRMVWKLSASVMWKEHVKQWTEDAALEQITYRSAVVKIGGASFFASFCSLKCTSKPNF